MPKRTLNGVVITDKVDKSVTVRVDRRVMHPLYKKYIQRSRKFAVHDPENRFKIGDTIVIRECPPVSKRKRWEVVSEVS
jgi:small subunit ribosomal protein S17